MSADSVIVFYGAQLVLSEEEVLQCELRRHPLMKAARDAHLDTTWGDFNSVNPMVREILVGRKVGFFGQEGSVQALIERGILDQDMNRVDAFLQQMGLPSPGKLIFLYCQDL